MSFATALILTACAALFCGSAYVRYLVFIRGERHDQASDNPFVPGAHPFARTKAQRRVYDAASIVQPVSAATFAAVLAAALLFR